MCGSCATPSRMPPPRQQLRQQPPRLPPRRQKHAPQPPLPDRPPPRLPLRRRRHRPPPLRQHRHRQLLRQHPLPAHRPLRPPLPRPLRPPGQSPAPGRHPKPKPLLHPPAPADQGRAARHHGPAVPVRATTPSLRPRACPAAVAATASVLPVPATTRLPPPRACPVRVEAVLTATVPVVRAPQQVQAVPVRVHRGQVVPVETVPPRA